jgi:two-component system chemotaxis response regulator CheY
LKIDVLVVDDSAGIRKVIQRVLKQSTLVLGEMMEAGDGKQALAIMRTHKPGLVMADINMPEMDGMELLRQIKSDDSLRSVPVIMVTTEASATRVQEAITLGASGYVRKPFTPDEINRALGSVF